MFMRNWFKKSAKTDTVKAKEVKQVAVELVKKTPKNCPAPLLKKIAHDAAAENKDLASMALVCRGFYHATRPVLDEAKLAHHVIFEPTHANKDEIIAMAIANPDLVDKRIRHSKDRSGHVFTNKTIFQLGYGAGDDDFCLALKPAFIKRYGDENTAIAEMKRQREEMCLSEEEEKNKEAVSKAHLIGQSPGKKILQKWQHSI